MKKALVLAALALASLPHAARAGGDACANTAEDGQRARRDGKLLHARELFLSCAAEACQPLIRRDCSQWLSEVDAALPSIVVDAKDHGQDVADVKVTIDGEVVASKLDGKSIALDPGPHKLGFERASRAPVAQEIIAKEGVHARVVEVRFTDEATADAPKPPEPPRGHTALPWIVAGLGGAVAVTGAVLVFTAPAMPSNCDETSGGCIKKPGETDSQLKDDQSIANAHVNNQKLGVIMLVGGGFFLVAGLVWHFLEPTAPANARSGVPGAFAF